MRRRSVEVVGANFEGAVGAGGKSHSFNVDDVVLILQGAFDQQEAAAGDEQAVAVVQVGSNDDIGDAGFVFHGDEDEAFSGARALAGDDASGGADVFAIAAGFQLLGREDVAAAQFGATVVHGMFANGKAGAGVVGDEALFDIHGIEGEGLGRLAKPLALLTEERAFEL